MMNLHSKYDNMHKIGMIYTLKYTNIHVILSINYMLSVTWQSSNHNHFMSFINKSIEGVAIRDYLWMNLQEQFVVSKKKVHLQHSIRCLQVSDWMDHMTRELQLLQDKFVFSWVEEELIFP